MRPCPRWSKARALALVVGASAAGCAAATPAPEPPGPDPQPARLAIEAPRGAEVRVDGVFVGTTPLPEPIDAEPGRHRVVVTLDGHEPRVEEVTLERAVETTLDMDLEETEQRIGAWVALGTGAAGVGTGIVLGVLAVVEQRNAIELVSGPAYEDAIAARDAYRVAAGVAGGTGLVVFVAGALLFSFDRPEPPAPVEGDDAPQVSVLPLLAPGFVGAQGRVGF